jgi:hypothetical protein
LTGERPEVAETVATERQLTGIINLEDCFKAAKSVDRPSSLDPSQPVNSSRVSVSNAAVAAGR